jgi:hypothetical protein
MARPIIAIGAVAFGGVASAQAEIKDYEVLRLLYLHTPCGMASVTSRETTPERVRFKADCQNLTAFPDGAEVVCTDHNDDRSCRVETNAKDFNNLELLKQDWADD